MKLLGILLALSLVLSPLGVHAEPSAVYAGGDPVPPTRLAPTPAPEPDVVVRILDADENVIVLASGEDVMLAANGGEQQLFVEGGLFKILNANCFMYLYPAGCIRLTSLTAPEGVVIESNTPRWRVSADGRSAARHYFINLPVIFRAP